MSENGKQKFFGFLPLVGMVLLIIATGFVVETYGLKEHQIYDYNNEKFFCATTAIVDAALFQLFISE